MVAVTMVGLGTYKTYGSYVSSSNSKESLLLAENIEALSAGDIKDIMEKIILGVVFVFLFLCSCSAPNNKETQTFLYHGTITEVEDSVAWSDLVDSVSYIKLETNDKCKIGEVNQLLVANERIYVVSNGIHCFNMEGNHLFSINQRGRAKNEYVEIRNVNIVGDQLYLYDNHLAKNMIFDCYTGAYIDCTPLPREVAAAYGLNDKVIIDRKDLPLDQSMGDDRFILSPRTDVLNTSEGYFSEDEHKFVIEGTTSVFSRGIIYSSYLNCMAWTLTDDGCAGYLKLDLPSSKMLSKYAINQIIKNRSLPDKIDKSIYGLSYIAESKDFITGRLSYDDHFAHFIYDKRSDNVRCYNKVAKKEPWQFSPISFQCGDDVSLFCLHSSDGIVLMREILGVGNVPSGRDIANYDIYCSETEFDNPIVARFYLKHF